MLQKLSFSLIQKVIFRAVKFSLFLFFVSFFFASAYYNPGVPTGFVNDYADILDVSQRQTLENKLLQVKNDSSNEIAVVTISDLRGDTIENFAGELFKQWGIGEKGKDNGILILVSSKDRAMRIEVGYGLEGVLTDVQASWIINDVMKPAFRENRYYDGIDGAVSKIVSTIGDEHDVAGNLGVEGIVALLFLFFVFVGSFLSESKSYWLGGGVGVLVGGIVGVLTQSWDVGLWSAFGLGVLGLFSDYLFSFAFAKGYIKKGSFGRDYGDSGRGSGGFGGGSSGGGGASGKW